MQLFRNSINLSVKFPHGSVVTVGNYDGVHLGHQKILSQLVSKAKELNLPSVVVIFEPQPEEFFSEHHAISRLCCLREKLRLLKEAGIENVICLHFNSKFSELSAEQFVAQILVAALQVRYLIVGHDFVFGHNSTGDINLLRKASNKYGFAVEEISACMLNGVRISSSLIRAAVASADFKLAEKFLGRPYSLSGKVVHGDKRGRDLAFPTANVYLSHLVLPLTGVFVVRVLGLDKAYFGVANVGVRPTIEDTKKLLEVYIFNFNAEIYGKFICVEFLHKLREEKKFASFALLKKQIAKDVINAQKFLGV